MSNREGSWVLPIALAAVASVTTQLCAVAINAATSVDGRWPAWLEPIRQFPFRSATALTVVLMGLAVAMVIGQQRRRGVVEGSRPAPVRVVPPWVVGRPAEVDQVVRQVCRRGGELVGITTGLHGAGGFGKTTVATMVCADRRVRRHFRDQIYNVTIGRDVRGRAAIAARVSEVTQLITGETRTFTDPQMAGTNLGRLLDKGPRLLLVIDDVWEAEQLEPFMIGGPQCIRLVTTRVATVLSSRAAESVRVDRMSRDQARTVLTWELGGGLPPKLADELLAITGRWPLLLRLANRLMADGQKAGLDVATVAQDLLDRMRHDGPVALDELTSDGGELGPDSDLRQAHAVRAAIEPSTARLPFNGAARWAELGVFAEDETIPVDLVLLLWQQTAGLDPARGRVLIRHLVGLALLNIADPDGGVVAIHDVVRTFLRNELGPDRLTTVHGALLDSVAAALPTEPSADGAAGSVVTAWWQLGERDRYLWDQLIQHMIDAGKPDLAEAVVIDLRWVAARLCRFGTVAPIVDLSAVGSGQAQALKSELIRIAHLLLPTRPDHAVVAVLLSRLQHHPTWGRQAGLLQRNSTEHVLVNRWPLPDTPDPALRGVFIGHGGPVAALAVAPDGSWLASGSGKDGTVRLWDVDTGRQRISWEVSRPTVWFWPHSMVIRSAPDGTWLAVGSSGLSVQVREISGGRRLAAPPGRLNSAAAVAVAGDESWLAVGVGRRVLLWDVATDSSRARLVGRARTVFGLVVAPDSSWLAAADRQVIWIWDPHKATVIATFMIDRHINPDTMVSAPDGTWLAVACGRSVVVWDMRTHQQRFAIEDDQFVGFMVAAPDSSWLAASSGGFLRLWDASSGQQRANFHTDPYGVDNLAVTPDGTKLVTTGRGGVIRIWDLAGVTDTILIGHSGTVNAVIVDPKGSWVATGSDDQTVRVWNLAPNQSLSQPARRGGWTGALVSAPDGSWLAAATDNHTVQVLDVTTGQPCATLAGHSAPVYGIAVAPDGAWVATASGDHTIRVWDPITGESHAGFTGGDGWVGAVAVGPDGTWLAAARQDRTIRIWDTSTRHLRATIPTGHTGLLWAMVTAPDGSWLASASSDGSIRVWDTTTGACRATLVGHRKSVRALAVAPDGSWLASASTDRTIRIWDMATGRLIMRLIGHTAPVRAVAATATGSMVLSAGEDCTLRLWDLGTARCRTLQRAEGHLVGCASLPHDTGFAAAGAQGLYLFEHRAPSVTASYLSPAAGHS